MNGSRIGYIYRGPGRIPPPPPPVSTPYPFRKARYPHGKNCCQRRCAALRSGRNLRLEERRSSHYICLRPRPRKMRAREHPGRLGHPLFLRHPPRDRREDSHDHPHHLRGGLHRRGSRTVRLRSRAEDPSPTISSGPNSDASDAPRSACPADAISASVPSTSTSRGLKPSADGSPPKAATSRSNPTEGPWARTSSSTSLPSARL